MKFVCQPNASDNFQLVLFYRSSDSSSGSGSETTSTSSSGGEKSKIHDERKANNLLHDTDGSAKDGGVQCF